MIDSLGALLSTVMLGVVLVKLEALIGMPKDVLYVLAAIAGMFSIYSLLGFVGIFKNRKPYLKIIAVANLTYCCLTMGMIAYVFDKLTYLGLAYFMTEIVIIVILAIIEFRIASNQNS